MRTDRLQGALEMLILKSLEHKDNHGFGITLHVQTVSEGLLRVEEGSLYPALQRILLKGWVTAEWAQTGTKRRLRVYSLTPEGREQLDQEISAYRRVSQAIERVIEPA